MTVKKLKYFFAGSIHNVRNSVLLDYYIGCLSLSVQVKHKLYSKMKLYQANRVHVGTRLGLMGIMKLANNIVKKDAYLT